MAVTQIGDPRLSALFGGGDAPQESIKPVVRLPRPGLSLLAIGAIALAFAVALFLLLNARRGGVETSQSALAPVAGTSPVGVEAPPALDIPPSSVPTVQPIATPVAPIVTPPPLQRETIVRTLGPQTVYVPQPIAQVAPPPPMPQVPRTSAGAPLVIDTGSPSGLASSRTDGLAQPDSASGPAQRLRASAFANRSSTVPQGNVIPAVLETAFNSTQAGFARAIVSRDVRSFDGKNILIPRGSRLIGKYSADVAQGQNRAVIAWSRLIRPDGMTIALDSPTTDPQGRGGVKAAVDSHFMARLGDALLQSTIQLGSAFTQRSVTGPVVVMEGSAASATGQAVGPRNYTPTLSLPAGKSISVFVAHDLDFGALDPRE